MSIQSSATTSSPTSRFAPNEHQKYYDLSGSSVFKSNSYQKPPSNPKPAIIKHRPWRYSFNNQNQTKNNQYTVYQQYNTSNKLVHSFEYNVCFRTFTYCFILITCGTLMIISRKLQNQTITKIGNNGQHSHFRHQWIQTWFFFLAKLLLILLVFAPCYNATSGISHTYYSSILINHNIESNIHFSRRNKFKTYCLRQLIYIILAINLLFGQFLLNVALFYMSGSIWMLFISIIILYICAFKFFLISPSIIVFIGVFCIITGNIMMISTHIHTSSQIAAYSMSTSLFALATFCLGLLFMTFYYMIYEYYYAEYKAYCEVLIRLKSFRKSKREAFNDTDFGLKHNIENNLIFYNWNHITFVYMEGFYGLLFSSIIIIILNAVNMDAIDGNVGRWMYENVSNFINCLKYNPLNLSMLIIYVLAVIINDITLEISKSYLSPFHSKLIYFVTIFAIWCIDLLIHSLFSPNTDKMFDAANDVFYGEVVTWYSILQVGAFLFIILGIHLFDERYAVYLNGMMEHNGLIIKQQRINLLTRYWNDIYYKKEKERLCGFSPIHLRAKHNNYQMFDSLNDSAMNILDDNKEESSYNYHELSINSYNRDGTKLEGTINLLIGDGVSNALNQGPTKYYPALYL